jgi:hypothetical protein
MRAHQLNDSGEIINTIEVDSLDVFQNLVDASIGGGIGDSIINGQLVVKPPVVFVPEVPKQVTRRQARLAMFLTPMGNTNLLDFVPTLIASIEDPTERRMSEIEWQDSQVFERDRPIVNTLGAQAGLTKEQIDQLFIQAATL